MLRMRVLLQDRLNSFRLILLSFILLILAGAVLLRLPMASAGGSGEGVPFLDALFTAASAVCVTGLVVYDTATKWTLFGKAVILLLIQVGGLGVVTAGAALLTLSGMHIGILSRVALRDAVSAPQIGGILRFMRFMLCATACIEGLGALCLLPFFAADYGLMRGAGYALFHSVSAFCNAGFDLMGHAAPFSSLTSYSGSVPVNAVIMLLILLGGLGFLTLQDLIVNRFRFQRLRLQTRIILAATAVLLAGPFLYFYLVEFRASAGKERVLLALFQSVTPRTAGFNTYDYARMREGGWLLTVLLMMVGGAPGSTAGGMKVTTAAVLILSARAYLGRRDQVNCFHRRIDPEAIRCALALMMLYTGLLLAGTMFLSTAEELPVLPAMFECASALGTVGLTTGITAGLSASSRVLLIAFMLFGRVGGLTLGYALASSVRTNAGQLPVEKVSVG